MALACAFPCSDSPVEAVPGIWGQDEGQGILCVVGRDEFDTTLEPGTKVAEVHSVSAQTRVCQACGGMVTDAWLVDRHTPSCRKCGTYQGGGHASCRMCSAGAAECCVLSYEGCRSCKPERQLHGCVHHGPAAGLLARAGRAFEAGPSHGCSPGLSGASEPVLGPKPGLMEQPVFHIVEEAGGIRHLTECEVPTEVYNDARTADLTARYPDLSPGV